MEIIKIINYFLYSFFMFFMYLYKTNISYCVVFLYIKMHILNIVSIMKKMTVKELKDYF